MAYSDRYPKQRERNPRGWDRPIDDRRWREYGRGDRNDQANLRQPHPRQGGRFEDRYSGRGGDESSGSEAEQRGGWREDSYGRGRYENEDHLRAGGSYGGHYHDDEESFSSWRHPSDEATHDWRRSQYGYGASHDPNAGWDSQRNSPSSWGNGEPPGWQRGDRRFSSSAPAGHDPWSDDSGQDRYGGDYSTTGYELRGQWDRGFSDMSRTYGESDYQRGRSDQSYGGSWSGGVNRPQRQSFRGRGPKGYERSDERLKELICERLMEDPNIDASEVSVEVRHHEVTLEGCIDDRRTKYEIEELVERCGGVRDVKNQLRVRARGSESGVERGTPASYFDTEPSYGTSGRSGITGGTAGADSGTSTTGGSGGSR
jgi:hypothetical protein